MPRRLSSRSSHRSCWSDRVDPQISASAARTAPLTAEWRDFAPFSRRCDVADARTPSCARRKAISVLLTIHRPSAARSVGNLLTSSAVAPPTGVSRSGIWGPRPSSPFPYPRTSSPFLFLPSLLYPSSIRPLPISLRGLGSAVSSRRGLQGQGGAAANTFLRF